MRPRATGDRHAKLERRAVATVWRPQEEDGYKQRQISVRHVMTGTGKPRHASIARTQERDELALVHLVEEEGRKEGYMDTHTTCRRRYRRSRLGPEQTQGQG